MGSKNFVDLDETYPDAVKTMISMLVRNTVHMLGTHQKDSQYPGSED